MLVLIIIHLCQDGLQFLISKEVSWKSQHGYRVSGITLVLDTFLVATIGALRGIMMKNLKGTPLDAFYLPLIPMEQFKAKSK